MSTAGGSDCHRMRVGTKQPKHYYVFIDTVAFTFTDRLSLCTSAISAINLLLIKNLSRAVMYKISSTGLSTEIVVRDKHFQISRYFVIITARACIKMHMKDPHVVMMLLGYKY
jgi:hypothetical protein